jgi:predicted DNA-binding transcriptional regulator YafY
VVPDPEPPPEAVRDASPIGVDELLVMAVAGQREQVFRVHRVPPVGRRPHARHGTTGSGQSRSATREKIVFVDTPGRLLRLLTLLSARPWWNGADLTDRLEVTDRTLRRDVTRLRALGYPIEATTGPYGGYRLGAGGRLPPLLLEDDEAVAAAVALRAASGGTASGLETAALSALTKLDQVLPVALRERVTALRTVTIDLRRNELPPADLDVLVVVAVTCRRPERLRFTYRDAEGTTTDRLVEPYRLVYTDRRWYLVAYDTGRAAWRTYRVDRMSEPVATGVPFARTDPPDAGAIVAEGLAVHAHALQARVRLDATAAEVARLVPATIGVPEPGEGPPVVVRIGGDPDWIARYVAGLPCGFEVIEPDEVRAEVRAVAARLAASHPA